MGKTGQYEEVLIGREVVWIRTFMCSNEKRNLEVKTSEGKVYFDYNLFKHMKRV